MKLSTAFRTIIEKHGRNTLAFVLNQDHQRMNTNDYRMRLDQWYSIAISEEYERINNGKSGGKLDKSQLCYTVNLAHVYDAERDGTVYEYMLSNKSGVQYTVHVYNDMLYDDLSWDDCLQETKASYFQRVPWWKWKTLN